MTLRLEFDSYGSMAAATLEARDRARRAYILTGVVTVFGAMGSVTRTAWRAGACLEGSQSNSLVERLVVGGFKLWPQERK